MPQSHDPDAYRDTKSHKAYTPIPESLEKVGKMIVDSAYNVHINLGPGLLEKVYEICFCHELQKRGLKYRRQVNIPIIYDNLKFEEGLRLDVIVEDQIICELKALETVNPCLAGRQAVLRSSDFKSFKVNRQKAGIFDKF